MALSTDHSIDRGNTGGTTMLPNISGCTKGRLRGPTVRIFDALSFLTSVRLMSLSSQINSSFFIPIVFRSCSLLCEADNNEEHY